MAGAVCLLLVVVVGPRFSPPKEAMPKGAALRALTSDKTTPYLRPAPLLTFASPTVSPRAGDPQIIKTASREELLAIARDLLAKGGSLADIVALLEYLTASKPEFALDLARDLGRTDGERHVLLYLVLSDWAHSDPPVALQWAFQKAGVYDVQGNVSLLYIVLEQVAGDDPRAALDAAENAMRADSDLPAANGGEAARLTIEALIKTGRGELARQAIDRWARGPEAASLDGAVYEVITLSLAQKSLDEAARWLQSLPSSPARNEAYSPIAAAWSQEDGHAAMDWAQGLNPDDGGDEVRVATFERWLKSDRPAATQWLSAHDTIDNTRLISLLNQPITSG